MFPDLLIPHGKSFFGLLNGFWNPEKLTKTNYVGEIKRMFAEY